MTIPTPGGIEIISPSETLPAIVGVEILEYLYAALKSGQVSAFVVQDQNNKLSIMADVGPGQTETAIVPLVGPGGRAGPAQFPLILQHDIYRDPLDLPTVGTLTNTVADIGKFWVITQTDDKANIISVGAYIWFGTEYRFLPFGVQGPPGPYGVISPYVTLLPPDEQSQLLVSGDGTQDIPYLAEMELSIPQGPFGRCMPLAQFPDVDQAGLFFGDVLMATGSTVSYDDQDLPLWAASSADSGLVMPYTVPASAFNTTTGIQFDSSGFGFLSFLDWLFELFSELFGGVAPKKQPATIATFTVPAQPWAWKPIVFGQIVTVNPNLGLLDFAFGIEVRLGSPTGTLVARGSGVRSAGVVLIFPQTSSSAGDSTYRGAETASTQMTPWNSIGLVPANVGGVESTLFVNLINEGINATLDYVPTDAELLVWAVPVPTTPLSSKHGVVGALSCHMTFSAKNITRGS